jgi:hypothetical protein
MNILDKLPEELIEDISNNVNIKCYYCNKIISLSDILLNNCVEIGSSYIYCNSICYSNFFYQ